jgi:hypothetical protein
MSKNEPKKLILICCFCDSDISKDEIISIGAWYDCTQCDSQILTGEPISKGNHCSIKSWFSKIS